MSWFPDPRSVGRCLTLSVLALPIFIASSSSIEARDRTSSGSFAQDTDQPSKEAPPHPADARTWKILREMRSKPLPPLEEIGPRLATECGGRIATLFDMLETGRVPGAGGVPPQTLSIPQQDLILDTFRRLDPLFILGEARRRVAMPDLPATRLSAIRAAGAVGDESEVAWILDLASELTDESSKKLAPKALEAALAEILVRDPNAHDRLLSEWRRLSTDQLVASIQAIGEARMPRGLVTLCEVLSWREDLADLAIAQIPLICASDSF